LNKKIGIISLGCPKNLVDSEVMLGLLSGSGFEITNNEDEAEIIIVNTCGFIEQAQQESVNTILEMAQKRGKGCELLIVTGCMAQRYKEKILEEIPEVDAVVGTGSYGEIADIIKKAYEKENGREKMVFDSDSGIGYLDGDRVVSTGKSYAYLKIAEGCNNCCTYCVIPSLRGPYRSRSIESVVRDAEKLAMQGIKEVIITAQDTTRYGLDNYGSRKLSELIQRISKINGIEWIRLLYCYPEEIDDSLIDEIASNEKVCKYIDIPIQHASDRILKLMGRRGRKADIENLINKMRAKIPGLIIRTTLIAGFPTETENDFEELLDFVNRMKFDKLGVFAYSKEEGTPAAKMKPQVPKKIREQRRDRIMKLQENIVIQKNTEKIGNIYNVLVEGVADDGIFYYGRSYAEAPDIDGLIYFTSEEPLEISTFANVKILNIDNYDLIGEVTNEFAK